MNESECFNKLVDPVPETYIGLEPDGLYKECRQVNEKSMQESPYYYNLTDQKASNLILDWMAEKYSSYFRYL